MRAPAETLRYESGSVVLVAGVPGAGKSSLLRRLAVQTDEAAAGGGPPGPRIVDSDQVRALLPRPFTGGPGYLLTRGPVYLLHWIRIALAMTAPADVPVFVHDPATRAWTRHLVALLARLGGRRLHLLWVVAEPEQARAGQRLRGRKLPSTTQLGHEQRQRRIRAGLADGTVRFPGFASARFVTRAEAATLQIAFAQPEPSPGLSPQATAPTAPQATTPPTPQPATQTAAPTAAPPTGTAVPEGEPAGATARATPRDTGPHPLPASTPAH